jgi:predicted membrane protein
MNKFVRPCTLIWLLMMILTMITYGIGESGMGGTAIMLIVLGIAAIKVQMVANYFMDLRHTRWLWRGIVLGWLILVTTLISIAYLTTLK